MKGLAARALLALGALAAGLPVFAQEFQLQQRPGTDNGAAQASSMQSASVGRAGTMRTLRVTESDPGRFSVMERTPLGNSGGTSACVTRPRTARLALSGDRQILTIAPAVRGCSEIRLVIEADGTGREEERSGDAWHATGAYTVGNERVHSAGPVPPLPAMALAPQAAANVPVPAAAAEPAVALAVPASENQTRRDSPLPAAAAHRRALVIGNDAYRYVGVLLNARSDARAMGEALQRSGFQVTLRLDVDEKAFKQALREFHASIEGGDEVVVFYSGHGVQVGGTNYLLPVDIHGDSEEQVRDDAMPLQRILDDAADRHARFTLAVVDACRDNPFKGSGRAIAARGLAPTTAATGQMVIYSAGSGQQALDRLGPADPSPNGLFTRVFLREMERPGVPVDRVLRNVRSEVGRLARSVGHAQTPALYDQTEGDFYLKPPP